MWAGQRSQQRWRRLLARHRLVTVTGPGGSGKTRVAIEVARGVAPRFEDGVWLVELAQVEDPGLVPTAVAVVLGVREQPGLSLAESLAAVMGGRHVLLVLDNCEHVIDAAAGLCDRLLRAGDDLRVLATSREPLGVAGEARFPLPPLPVPAGETAAGLAECESVALFAERAGQADPDFTLTPASGPAVATIVQRLDGMPLAIELAAAQLDTLGLGQLVAGLDDRFRVLVSQTRGVVAAAGVAGGDGRVELPAFERARTASDSGGCRRFPPRSLWTRRRLRSGRTPRSSCRAWSGGRCWWRHGRDRMAGSATRCLRPSGRTGRRAWTRAENARRRRRPSQCGLCPRQKR